MTYNQLLWCNPPEERAKMNIAWSLKPVLMFTKICGITTIDIEPNTENSFCRVTSIIFWRISGFTCLLLNCFLNIYRLVRYYKRKWICDGFNRWLEHTNFRMAFAYMPLNAMDEFEMWAYTIFMIGVPLVFTFQCLFTRKFRKILSSIRKIDESLVLSANFYQRCRRHCILLILYFLTVRNKNLFDWFALFPCKEIFQKVKFLC